MGIIIGRKVSILGREKFSCEEHFERRVPRPLMPFVLEMFFYFLIIPLIFIQLVPISKKETILDFSKSDLFLFQLNQSET